ncbi:25633_t:CDS:2 [Gigaspora margarita]|uniref:25633_t:CDS:1 n=1 Tax=Gigaspora margarita TaxID=4874 RepID=A0ABM8VW56_GIGMA|nr:25633_t:CDS:2 [Gigaspora margarita]
MYKKISGEQPEDQVFLDFYKSIESVTQEQNGPEVYTKCKNY